MYSRFSSPTGSVAGHAGSSDGGRPPALSGAFCSERLLSGTESCGLPALAGGLCIGFLPAGTTFPETAERLRQATADKGGAAFAAVSTAGALCSGNGSVYCGTGNGDEDASYLWLSGDLLECVESFAIDLQVGHGSTVGERVELIGRALQGVCPSFELNDRDSFALVFSDGLAAAEGLLMRAWYESRRFPCLAIGGSAGGACEPPVAQLHDGRQSLSGHALVIFCKVRQCIRFSAFRSQNFTSTGRSWRVAEADPLSRTVTMVVDDHGRSVALARVLAGHFGCPPAEVGRHLPRHAFAISVGGEMFIRSVAELTPDRATFFCDIEPGERLFLMEQTDFISTTQRDWQHFLSGKGSPLAMLLNDCVLRRRNNSPALGRADFFTQTPAAGFSTFGEFLGIPMNQTLSALVFFRDAPGYSDPFMNAFPVSYAAFSTHYTQRALERWVGRNGIQGSETGPLPAAPPPGPHEATGEAARDFNHLVSLLLEKELELEAGRRQLSRLAHHDALTGLPNRALLEDRLQHLLAHAERNEREIALLFCDLDGFKQINDRHGHEIGDKLLCAVAGRLNEGRRRMDTVARLGGDEFVILLGDLANARAAARIVAGQCLDALARPFEIGSLRLDVGISIGIATHRGPATDPLHLLSQADSAMYEVKRAGKRNFAFFAR